MRYPAFSANWEKNTNWLRVLPSRKLWIVNGLSKLLTKAQPKVPRTDAPPQVRALLHADLAGIFYDGVDRRGDEFLVAIPNPPTELVVRGDEDPDDVRSRGRGDLVRAGHAVRESTSRAASRPSSRTKSRVPPAWMRIPSPASALLTATSIAARNAARRTASSTSFACIVSTNSSAISARSAGESVFALSSTSAAVDVMLQVYDLPSVDVFHTASDCLFRADSSCGDLAK